MVRDEFTIKTNYRRRHGLQNHRLTAVTVVTVEAEIVSLESGFNGLM